MPKKVVFEDFSSLVAVRCRSQDCAASNTGNREVYLKTSCSMFSIKIVLRLKGENINVQGMVNFSWGQAHLSH